MHYADTSPRHELGVQLIFFNGGMNVASFFSFLAFPSLVFMVSGGDAVAVVGGGVLHTKGV